MIQIIKHLNVFRNQMRYFKTTPYQNFIAFTKQVKNLKTVKKLGNMEDQ